uniref:uncharacterized protein LOC132670663 n=1 Tax=Panthera onca TaxID=9690 RepID=UPI002952D0DB|nr:uncharacterized protein LOC132670663 [Panthera onca]
MVAPPWRDLRDCNEIKRIQRSLELSIGTLFLDLDMASSKKVTLSMLSREQSEGVGARVRRSIGRPELKNLDPFLLFDEFKGGRPGGFPDHPHRGFETLIAIRDQRNVENIILENSDHLKWDPRSGVFQQQPRGVGEHIKMI